MHLYKSRVLVQVYELVQAIEDCGASEKLTHAVTLAGALGEEVEKLVDQLAEYKAAENVKSMGL